MSLASEEPPTPPAPSPSATRDHLANERTLLAWGRTSVAIMGLGFIVARFGLLLRELARPGARPAAPGVSAGFGVALVLAGALLLALAFWRYLRVAADIQHNRVRWDPWLTSLLTGVLVLAGVVLAIYLLFTA